MYKEYKTIYAFPEASLDEGPPISAFTDQVGELATKEAKEGWQVIHISEPRQVYVDFSYTIDQRYVVAILLGRTGTASALYPKIRKR